MDGKPLFSQEAAPATEAPVKQSARELLRKKLLLAPLSDRPFLGDQEYEFPDSVEIVGTRFMVFDASSSEDMDAYSALTVSTRKRDKEVIVAEEVKWSESRSTWLVLIKVALRKFRALTASQEAELLAAENDEPVSETTTTAES